MKGGIYYSPPSLEWTDSVNNRINLPAPLSHMAQTEDYQRHTNAGWFRTNYIGSTDQSSDSHWKQIHGASNSEFKMEASSFSTHPPFETLLTRVTTDCAGHRTANLTATPNSAPLEEHDPPRPFMKLKEHCSTTSEVSTIADCRNMSRSDSSDHSECTLEEVEEEVRKQLVQMRQLPYLDYVCHRCGKKDHFIKNCSMENSKRLTPYQGALMSEGSFVCVPCSRTWHSCATFSNVAQKCLKCGNKIFPHRMKPINRKIDDVDYRFNLCNIERTTTFHW